MKRAWVKVVALVAAVVLPVLSIVPVAHASGSSSITLSPASGTYTTSQSFTVGVYVNAPAGDSANAAEADFTVSGLTITNVTVANCPLTIPPYGSNYYSGNSVQIDCANNGGYSGSVLIGTITVTASATAGSSSITAANSSDVQAGGTSVFNGTLPSAHFTISAPASGGGGTGGGGSGGGTSGGGGTTSGGSSGGTSSGGTSSGSSNTSPNSGSPAPTTPPPVTTPTQTTPVDTPPSSALTITVTDGKGKPVKGAKVSLDDHYTTYTDANGKAGFSSIASGSHKVAITADGKKTVQQNVTLTAAQTKQVSLKLSGTTSPVMILVLAAAGLLIVGGGGFGFIKLSGRGMGGMKGPQVPVQGMVVGSDAAPAVRITTPTTVTPSAPSSSSIPTVVQPTTPPANGGDTTPKPQ